MAFDGYKVVIYRNQPSGWVAEIPAISGCFALMPTRAEALSELEEVFKLIEAEYQDNGQSLPADTTEVVHAWRKSGRFSPRSRKIGDSLLQQDPRAARYQPCGLSPTQIAFRRQ